MAIGILIGVKFGTDFVATIGSRYAATVAICICICIFATGFAWSWGPLGWLVPNEIFLLEIWSVTQSINVSVTMFFTFLIAQVFLQMLHHFKFGLFFFFAAFTLLGVWWPNGHSVVARSVWVATGLTVVGDSDIPSAIGRLQNLSALVLGKNKFSEPIPSLHRNLFVSLLSRHCDIGPIRGKEDWKSKIGEINPFDLGYCEKDREERLFPTVLQVGEDKFGYMLSDTLKQNNIDNSSNRFDPAARTTLTLVTPRAEGENKFMFFRNSSADLLFWECLLLYTDPEQLASELNLCKNERLKEALHIANARCAITVTKKGAFFHCPLREAVLKVLAIVVV
ncbi:hypothetical protein GIB67_028052 [Kingdonia uniflora]|uniref:Carbohydrate kinase PfkB domain-containing protein n=1 Tax=Kingdonia uniflora TaxID=39325 RepID=A0A7J7L1B8_9MAGN|nr:hypothetical protein GIB67_028052 [Kingdonia uniflora]